jgi:c-di-GMP-binding flagellar brake protein YcgR
LMDEDSLALNLIQSGKNVQVEILNENGKKKIYRTSVWNFEGEQIKVLRPQNDQLLNNIQPGAKITLICRNDNNSYDYVLNTALITMETEPPLFILSKPADFKLGVGRHFFRCEVNLPFQFFAKTGKCQGTAIDLSVNGLFAVIDPQLNLDTGATTTCQMALPGYSKPLLFVAKIMRILKKDNFQGMGLSFQQLDKSSQDQITKYLFQRQRAMMNQGQICIVKSGN